MNRSWHPQCLAIFPAHPHLLPPQLLNLTMKLMSHGYAEGEVRLMTMLMSKAIPYRLESAESKPLREWTLRDFQTLLTVAQEEWKAACRCELDILCEHKVFELVDAPKGHKVISNRWVFDVKPDGRKCARLVAKGFSQIKGIDFDHIFSLVVRFETVQLMLALTALENWHIEALNVRSAYLYGKLKEEIYMKQHQGFRVPGQEHKVLCLLCALYGLKQAGLAWWETLNESMKELGFERLKSDASIFLFWKKGTNIVVAVVYVDDSLFCGPTKAIVKEVKDTFMHKWECRDLGPAKEFLHMRIHQDGSNIMIDQCAYLEKVLEQFQMQNAKITPTPLPQGYYPLTYNGPVDPALQSRYQQVIGSLLYLSLGTRPDIA